MSQVTPTTPLFGRGLSFLTGTSRRLPIYKILQMRLQPFHRYNCNTLKFKLFT